VLLQCMRLIAPLMYLWLGQQLHHMLGCVPA
jgi:hypothetical protein